MANKHGQVAKGQADPKRLAAEKQRLGRMQQQLDTLEAEASVTQRTANRLFGFLGIGGGSNKREPADARGAAKEKAAAAAAKDGGGGGGGEGRGDKKGGAAALWETLGGQLTWLEGALREQESATEKKKAAVSSLRDKVGCVAHCRRCVLVVCTWLEHESATEKKAAVTCLHDKVHTFDLLS